MNTLKTINPTTPTASTFAASNDDRPPVIRSCALTVDSFDIFKSHQRRMEGELGERLSNGQALDLLLREYSDLRAATLDNPQWDFDEAHDGAIAQGVASGRLRPAA